MDIIEFEKRVMTALLAGDDPILAILRNQYAVATVSDRKFSGVGFFTTYSIPPHLPRVEPHNFHIGDIHVEVSGVSAGVGIVLFVRDGAIDFLEGFTYDGPWPDSLELLSLSYIQLKPNASNETPLSEERELEFVRGEWKRIKI
jgi:hypothetical protein